MIPAQRRAHRVLLTYGRFDGLSQTHLKFLKALSDRGDDLIVGCTTDRLAIASGIPCLRPYEERRAMLESCRFVSRVIPNDSDQQKRTDIVNYNACALAMGAKWVGKFDSLQDIAQVLYIGTDPGHSDEAVFAKSRQILTA